MPSVWRSRSLAVPVSLAVALLTVLAMGDTRVEACCYGDPPPSECDLLVGAAAPTDRDVAVITWSDGSVVNVRLTPPTRRPTDQTQAGTLERLEYARRNYEERLGKGDYYFVSMKGLRVTGGAAGSASILPRLIPILRSSVSLEAKWQEAQLVKLPFDADTLGRMAAGFSASPQLELRLRAIAPTGEPPASPP